MAEPSPRSTFAAPLPPIWRAFPYPAEWTTRLFNEQHMLAAYLLGRQDAAVDFAAFWMSRTEAFAAGIEALFAFDTTRQIQLRGGCLFFRS